jgi:pimeloyl-ACP methyl ester carboxylesterase
VTAVTITQTQTIEVDGLRIRYADSGTAAGGPVTLFTSPWPESLFAFRRVWPALAPAGRLVAVDLPGFGYGQLARMAVPGTCEHFMTAFQTE